MAILRNKQETKGKLTYNEEYRAGIEKAAIEIPAKLCSESQCADIVLEEVILAQNEPSPSQILMHLEALSWALVNYGESSSLTNLWKRVQDLAAMSFQISLRFWQQVNEYLSERLGNFLYIDYFPHRSSN